MRKLLKNSFYLVFLLTACAPAPKPPGKLEHWAIYYSNKLPANAFESMDLVVFDRTHYPKFEKLKGKAIVLGYVSGGEINDHLPEKAELDRDNALLYQQDAWKSHAVDLTSPRWHTLVLSYVADAEKKGFDGVMLDTLDGPLYWAKTKAPERYGAMCDAAVDLIREIREAHPKMKLMVNRGFQILPRVARDIDYVLAESILANTDVSTGQSVLFPPHTYGELAGELKNLQTISPSLKIFTLDYWNQEDVNGLERIYTIQRGAGFIPYVTSPSLNDFTPEPLTWRGYRK